MNPDEMRREANRLRLVADLNGARGWEHNAESCRRGADALDRLADVIEYAEPFAGKQFAGFAAMWDAHPEMVEVVRIAHGETTNHEERRER